MTVTDARLEARVTKEIHALLKRAAEIEGRSLSDFVISAAKAAAQETIQQTEMLKLSVADQKIFADALIRPTKPNAALRRASKRHKQLISNNGE